MAIGIAIFQCLDKYKKPNGLSKRNFLFYFVILWNEETGEEGLEIASLVTAVTCGMDMGTDDMRLSNGWCAMILHVCHLFQLP